jgi:hypothetical protein
MDLNLEALRAKHGRITHVRYNGYDLVFRRPNVGEAQMYRTYPMDTGEDRYQATATMAQFIVVYPSVEELNALHDEYPFMFSSEGVNAAIATAMGIREEKKDSTPLAQGKTPIPSASRKGSPTGSPSAPEAS